MNSLYQQLSGNQGQPTPVPQQEQPQNNFGNYISRLTEFIQTFKGDPKQQVQQLLQSGGVNKAQYDQAVQQANMIYNLINGKK